MTAELGPNRYGKSAIRLVRVDRSDDGDRVRDLTVAIALEGDFAASYVDGDNSLVVATDTMKNTAYALAAEHLTGAIETYAAALGRHFLEDSQVSTVTVSIDEFAWRPIGSAPDAFTRDRTSTRTCVVAMSRDGLTVDAGIADLVVMKTSKSAFSGFPRDAFTTLPDTDDRLLATSITASWTYREGTTDFGVRDRIRAALLETFAAHRSRSVQHTLYAMGEAALAAAADATEITLTLPNRHHLPVDLAPFGLDNPNEIFVATDQPYGVIEATIKR